MPLQLYLDANVWLSIYQYSPNDLEQVKRIEALLVGDRVTILLPGQTEREFERNRDRAVAEALKQFEAASIPKAFPNIARDYPDYARLDRSRAEFESARRVLLDQIREDFGNRSLRADLVISELFGKAKRIEETTEMLERARLRMTRGDPPGKRGSFGDAINWEGLLVGALDGEALYFVSDDGDFRSRVHDDRFDPALIGEFRRLKSADLHFFRSLRELFRDQFEEIRLEDEIEKARLVSELMASETFRTTHNVLWDLARKSNLSATQLNDVIRAALENNQITWIVGDSDVNSNLKALVQGRDAEIEPALLKRFRRLLAGEDSSEVDDFFSVGDIDPDELPF